jgi:hypothetical protein
MIEKEASTESLMQLLDQSLKLVSVTFQRSMQKLYTIFSSTRHPKNIKTRGAGT